MLRDGGGALTGPLAVFDRWDHRMAVSALPDGRTLYRDQLLARAGALDLVAWYPTWAFWQWRGMRLRQLAPRVVVRPARHRGCRRGRRRARRRRRRVGPIA